jgi:hypothetical protein
MAALDKAVVIDACNALGNNFHRESSCYRKRILALLTVEQVAAMKEYGLNGWRIRSITMIGQLEVILSHPRTLDYRIHIQPDGHPKVY